MEEKLTNYIKEKYQPLAIMIHGSRANGHAKEHSDWDFVILVDRPVAVEREIVFDQNIEVFDIQYPVNEELIKKYVPEFRSSNVKVVFDPNAICTEIIEKATLLTEKGRPVEEYTGIEKSSHCAWMLSHIDGMIDYKEDQLAFFRKCSEFYVRALQYWFRFKKHTWMLQVYESLPQIKREDPEYFALLEVLAGDTPSNEKIVACKKIQELLFN